MKYSIILIFFGAYFSLAQNVEVSTGAFFEGEPTLAVHPQNSQILVAAWMGVDLALGGVIKTSYSNNGGLTWSTPQPIQHEVVDNGSADPSLQYDASGNVYLCYIDFDNTNFTNGQIVVRKSTDNGANWSNSAEAINVTDCPGKLCVDRPWMEIDRSGGPNDGTIYVTSMNPDQPTMVTPPYNPYLAVSTDGGNTFNTPRFIDTLGYYSGSVITQPMPSPAIGADGTFYAMYPSYDTAQSPFARFFLAYSTTKGIDLDHDLLYNIFIPGVSDPFAKAASQLFADPSIPNHLVSIHLSSLNGDVDVFFMESFDGFNWTSPERVNQDPIGNGKMQDLIWGGFNENGDMAICWRDRRNATGSGYQTETEIWGTVRYKDSTNFEPDFMISSQQASHETVLEGKGNDFQSIRFVGDTLYTIWGDVRSGTLRIYINRMNVPQGTNSTTEIVAEPVELKLFPNPSSDIIEIKNIELAKNVAIYSIKGELVEHVGSSIINVSQYDSGKYIMRYNQNGKSHSIPFVIN